MASIISLIIIIVLSILINRIATIALTHTGISYQVAKFQARSAFTGVGFTTDEAESITQHPVRRKIVLTLMLLGNAGVVSAVSSLILTFIGEDKGDLPDYVSLLVIGVSILLLWLLSRSQLIDRGLKKAINYALHKYTDLNVKDYNELLNLSGEYGITELSLEHDNWLTNNTLARLSLKEEGIIVLGIKRSDGSYLGIPEGENEIKTGDRLVLYGREQSLKELSERKRGAEGDQEHEEAKDNQKNVRQREETSGQES